MKILKDYIKYFLWLKGKYKYKTQKEVNKSLMPIIIRHELCWCCGKRKRGHRDMYCYVCEDLKIGLT